MMEPHELSNNDWVKYQALKGMEETLRKEAEAKLVAAEQLGRLALEVLENK
jgi:hypothetical protein